MCQSGAACPWLINAPDSLFNLFAGPSRASYGDPDVTPANLPSVRLNSSAVIYLEGQRRGKRGPQKWFVSLRRESKPRSQLVRVCASDWDVRVWRRAPIGPFKWKWQFRWNYFTSTFAGCFCVFQKHPAVIYDYIYHQNSDGCTSLYPPLKKRKHFAWILSRVVGFESTTRRMSASFKVHYAGREALVRFAWLIYEVWLLWDEPSCISLLLAALISLPSLCFHSVKLIKVVVVS